MNTEDSEFARIEREQAMRNVPDAIHHTDTSEPLMYIQGWNDCRQAMLAEKPAPATYTCGACGVSMRMEQPAPAAQQEPETKDVVINNMGSPFAVKAFVNPQPAPVQQDMAAQILREFPLFDDVGLDEEKHHCEWTLLQDRKRLHAMVLNAAPQAQPASVQQEPEIVQRVKRYAGQTLRTARNPNITARECIELADWLATTPQAQRKPLTDEQLRSMCKQTWVFETVKQWARVIEAAHNIKEKS